VSLVIVTCHLTQVTTPAIIPAKQASDSFSLSTPEGVKGRLDLSNRLHTEMVFSPTDGHPFKHKLDSAWPRSETRSLLITTSQVQCPNHHTIMPPMQGHKIVKRVDWTRWT